MNGFRLGEIEISEVVESYAVRNPDMFAGSTPEAVTEHRRHLPPPLFTLEGEAVFVIRSYVVRTRHHSIVVDTCYGNHKPRKTYPAAGMLNSPYLQNLRRTGVGPEDVNYVLCTHLHMDHIGWNTRLETGHWVPTFPRAKYLFGRKDWEHWTATDRGDYTAEALPDSILPIAERGLSVLVDGKYEIEDGITVVPLPGHTPGHSGLHLKSGGQDAVMTGDMAHHAIQLVEPDWGGIADSDPVKAQATRRAFVERYADTGTLVLAAHFPLLTGGRLKSFGGGFRFDILE